MVDCKDRIIEMKHSAVFLDRDGVLCTEKGYVTTKNELEIFPYTRQAVDLIHKKGFLAICVTNQSAVARGMVDEKALQGINEFLIQEVGLDAIYYCPHHPKGVGKYGIKCGCRKPNTGMLEMAIKEWAINREESYIVGDRASDIICGKNAGLKTVLVESGFEAGVLEELVSPDKVYANLEKFVFALNPKL